MAQATQVANASLPPAISHTNTVLAHNKTNQKKKTVILSRTGFPHIDVDIESEDDAKTIQRKKDAVRKKLDRVRKRTEVRTERREIMRLRLKLLRMGVDPDAP